MVQFRLVLFCSIVLCFSVVSSTKTCFAQEAGVIYIRADGSIDPPTAPISTVDNVTYVLTGNITSNADGIVIERDSIVVDGSSFTVEGVRAGNSRGIYLEGRSNMTIQNIKIKNFDYGIDLYFCSNNSVIGNTMTNNYVCIITYECSNNTINGNTLTTSHEGIGFSYSFDNSISWNNIADNNCGIWLADSSNNGMNGNNITNNIYYGIGLESSSNNSIYHNNFIDNAEQVHIQSSVYVNFWDDGFEGNFWSDYNGTDSNQDGIGDTPYIIDANNTDHYPLMAQYAIPEFPAFLFLPLFMIATLLAALSFRKKRNPEAKSD